jgi:hypothetical protein
MTTTWIGDRLDIMVATQPAVLRNRLSLSEAVVEGHRLGIAVMRAGEDDENDALCCSLGRQMKAASIRERMASEVQKNHCVRLATEPAAFTDIEPAEGILARLAEIYSSEKAVEDLNAACWGARDSAAVATKQQLEASLNECCKHHTELLDGFRQDFSVLLQSSL